MRSILVDMKYKKILWYELTYYDEANDHIGSRAGLMYQELEKDLLEILATESLQLLEDHTVVYTEGNVWYEFVDNESTIGWRPRWEPQPPLQLRERIKNGREK